jgi:type IX secretion system PorP/SprF family membrane protein
MKRFSIYSILFLISFTIAKAQENHFSQFYTAPQYVNPAFAGDTDYMTSGATSRVMKPNSDSYIVNTLLHFGFRPLNQKSGVGFTFYKHTEQLSHSKAQFNYSYSFQFGNSAWINAGLGISMNIRSTAKNELSFPDQYNQYGHTGNTSAEPTIHENSIFPGLSAGIVIYNKVLWMSFSGDYLNQPQENFAGQNNTYPLKISFLSGLLFPVGTSTSKRRINKFGDLKPHSSIGPIVAFSTQNKYIEISGGVSGVYKTIFGGIHYRYQHDYKQETAEFAYKAMVLMTGFRQDLFSFTYSYDYALSNYTINKAGAHEISVIFYLNTKKRVQESIPMIPLMNQLMY